MSDIAATAFGDGIAVTASDTTDDPAGPFQGLWTGTGGTIKVTTYRGRALSIANVPAGVILPLCVRRIWSTGTSATGVIGLKSLDFYGTS